jgi:hypothetical protein
MPRRSTAACPFTNAFDASSVFDEATEGPPVQSATADLRIAGMEKRANN